MPAYLKSCKRIEWVNCKALEVFSRLNHQKCFSHQEITSLSAPASDTFLCLFLSNATSLGSPLAVPENTDFPHAHQSQ